MCDRERESTVAARLMVFLDDGGVMNDNRTRALQWQRLVSEYFVPLLGGPAEAWSRANRVVADRLFEPAAWRRRIRAAADYKRDRKSTRLNSSHQIISYAVFCLKKQNPARTLSGSYLP